MQQKLKTFEELITQASDYLRNKFSKAENTIYMHVLTWRRVKKYMDAQKIEQFNFSVGREFIEKECNDRSHKELKRSECDAIHFVKVLCQFSDTGIIMPRSKPVYFEGEIGEIMSEYISYKITQRLKPFTIGCHKQTLYRFLDFLNRTGITSIKALSQTHLVNYIKTIDPSRVGLSRMCITNLRGFLNYIYRSRHLTTPF